VSTPGRKIRPLHDQVHVVEQTIAVWPKHNFVIIDRLVANSSTIFDEVVVLATKGLIDFAGQLRAVVGIFGVDDIAVHTFESIRQRADIVKPCERSDRASLDD
jgi:hypothetical protein